MDTRITRIVHIREIHRASICLEGKAAAGGDLFSANLLELPPEKPSDDGA
jgi:hypothetical protein